MCIRDRDQAKLNACVEMIREHNDKATIITTPLDQLDGREVLKTIEGADKLEDMMKFLIPNYAKEGKTNLVIAVGCTGGKHRSVTLARVLYDRLHAERSYGIRLEHRDIGKDALRKNK